MNDLATKSRKAGRVSNAAGGGRTVLGLSAALAAVFALMLARVAEWDSGTLLAVPVALLPYATVVTAFAALVLTAKRRNRLVVFAVAMLVTQVAWLAPRFLADGAQTPAGAPRLRVGTSNTNVSGADAGALVRLARTERLDVLAVEELTAAGVRALDAAGIRALFPYAELHPEVDTSIYSRLPLTRAGLLDRPTNWPQTMAEVRVHGRTVRIIAVHTHYPRAPKIWTADLAALADEARSSGPNTVMLGDFNATLDHAPMRALLDAGLIDSHEELGLGWTPTWPVITGLPPFLQIDHILHGSGMVAIAAKEHTVPGTDHRMVTAELALTG